MQNSIYIKNLEYQIGTFQLMISNLQWDLNRVTTLSGPSGSGKTTFIRILLGLEKGGQHFSWGIGGQELTHLTPRQRNIGFTFQDYSLFPHLTCAENIAFAAKAKFKKIESHRLQQIIAQFSLQNCQHTLAQNLSGGEQQRTALARAIITNPAFLILDEPFSALDADRKQEAKQFVKNLTDQFKIPTLLVTHDPDDVTFFNSQQLVITTTDNVSHIDHKKI